MSDNNKAMEAIALIKDLLVKVDRLIEERDLLNEECDGLLTTVQLQRDLLTGVVTALRGPPAPLSLHSHHDAPELAQKAMVDLHYAQAEAERLRHGVAVEGDFVCPDSLALNDLIKEVERYFGVLWNGTDTLEQRVEFILPVIDTKILLTEADP